LNGLRGRRAPMIKKKNYGTEIESQFRISSYHRFCANCSSYLSRQFEIAPSLDHSSDIEIEEIGIENGLNDTSDDGDRIEECLRVVAIDPVENIQRTIGAEGEKIMSSYRLRRACLGQQEELRQNRDRFEIDTERPQNLHDRKFVIDDQSEDRRWQQEEFDTESVVIAIICSSELEEHEIQSAERRGQKEDLHSRVVE